MSKLTFTGGYEILDEGTHDLCITDVEVNPPEGDIKSLKIDCVNREGVKWSSKYSLPRGEKALYVLVTKGLGFTKEKLDEGLDPQDMVGKCFTAEIIHRTSERGGTFANLGTIEGPCEPFEIGVEDTNGTIGAYEDALDGIV